VKKPVEEVHSHEFLATDILRSGSKVVQGEFRKQAVRPGLVDAHQFSKVMNLTQGKIRIQPWTQGGVGWGMLTAFLRPFLSCTLPKFVFNWGIPSSRSNLGGKKKKKKKYSKQRERERERGGREGQRGRETSLHQASGLVFLAS